METPRYLWVIANTYTRWLWKEFARLLGDETGLIPILLVSTEEDRKFYTRQFGEPPDFEIVVLKDPYEVVVAGGAPGLSADRLVARARQIEDDFGITLMRELVLADRHLGRGFMPAGSLTLRPRGWLPACDQVMTQAVMSRRVVNHMAET